MVRFVDNSTASPSACAPQEKSLIEGTLRMGEHAGLVAWLWCESLVERRKVRRDANPPDISA